MNIKNRLIYYLKPFSKSLLFAFVFALIFVICQLSQPFLLGKALDASKDLKEDLFNIYLIISLVLILIGTIFNYLFEIMVMNSSQKIIKNIRDDIYQKINAISISEFDKKNYGDIVQLEIKDIENLSSSLFAVFKTLIQGIFTIIITIILMVMVNWILALGVMILTPLSMLMSKIVSSFSYKHYKKQANLIGQLSSLSLEAINNIDTLQSYNYENISIDKFIKINDELKKEGKIALFSASWVNPSTRLVNNIIYVLIGIAGIIMLSYDSSLIKIGAVMSIGRLSSFLSYTNQYSKPFNEISNVVSEFINAKASFKRINDFLNINDDFNIGQINIDNIESIEFKNASFSYHKNIELIKNLNLKINKGNKIAIVGPTGAGKTTLINLLMRFYDIDDGDLLFNDISYIDINKKSIRNQVGMVLQDTWIFTGSIKDNISYYKKDATIEEIIAVSKKAHADVFINTLPNGYDTFISNKSDLSEGQKQMICIARTMLSNPNIVILDEATSNIDTRSEKLINDAFDKIMENKTSIVIAHRLSTIIEADTIIVMDNGHIIEVGNHQQLMDKKGFYYRLYSSQYK